MKLYMGVLCAFCCSLLFAQPTTEYGMLIGGSTYLGDLVESDSYPTTQTIQPSFSIYAAKSLSYTFQLRANVAYAGLQGDDQHFVDPEFALRSFKFESTLFELGIGLLWEPFAKRRFPKMGGWKTILSPYVFVGGAFTLIDSQTDFAKNKLDGYTDRIAADLENKPTSPAFAIPFGAGLRLDISDKTSLGLELGWRKTNTDYLDGVSVAGNASDKDWYIIGGVTLAYRFRKEDYDRDGLMDKEDQCPLLAGDLTYYGCPDADKDGIPDLEDMCPYQVGEKINYGCPDSDYDGVSDLLDDCPDLPGTKSGIGCPDSDGDGVKDIDDWCPNCPGEKALWGCVDSDKDGVIDAQDRCPNLAGKGEWQGCPYGDSDEDGIMDNVDECPNEKGLKSLQGCPDADEDGVKDELDNCPNEKGMLAFKGCPALPDTIKEILALVTEAIQFETASASLLASSLEKLGEIVVVMEDYPLANLSIEGHTDSQGNAAKNQQLSDARAKACNDYLVEKGIAVDRLHYQGFGESQPIANNNTRAGRKKNRRVVFELTE